MRKQNLKQLQLTKNIYKSFTFIAVQLIYEIADELSINVAIVRYSSPT
jgi:hypothetical protein